MWSTMAQLDFHDVLAVAVGVIIALAALNTVRWLFLRRRRFRLPEDMLIEMTRFAERFQRAAGQMTALSRLMQDPSRRNWRRKNAEILRVLRQMNRLLGHLNDFFQEQVQRYEGSSSEVSETQSDFTGKEEAARFRGLERITDEEISHTDWDELLRRLHRSDKPGDQR